MEECKSGDIHGDEQGGFADLDCWRSAKGPPRIDVLLSWSADLDCWMGAKAIIVTIIESADFDCLRRAKGCWFVFVRVDGFADLDC